MTWRSMNSAPRDGTWILALYPDRARVVRWRSGPGHGTNYAGGIVYYWSDGYFRHGDAEAWMPVPARSEQALAA